MLVSENRALVSEWNYKKNTGIHPRDFSCGSNKKVWWICDKGHEWEASVISRNRGTSCPFCSNRRVLKGFNDSELSLDMLSDLKSSGNTIVEKTNVGDLLQEVQEAKDKYQPQEDDGLDKSFYTSSLNFKEEDFEQLKDLQDSIDSNNRMIKILFFLLFLVIAGVVGFVIFKLI